MAGVAEDMVGELLSAQARNGLNINWATVSLASLLWAGGILQTMLELEWRQGLAGADAWRLGVLALRDSIQRPVLQP